MLSTVKVSGSIAGLSMRQGWSEWIGRIRWAGVNCRMKWVECFYWSYHIYYNWYILTGLRYIHGTVSDEVGDIEGVSTSSPCDTDTNTGKPARIKSMYIVGQHSRLAIKWVLFSFQVFFGCCMYTTLQSIQQSNNSPAAGCPDWSQQAHFEM